MTTPRRIAAALLVAIVPAIALAQGARDRASSRSEARDYDGSFTFTRIRYSSGLRGFGGASWAHDYPAADRNVSAIIDYVTNMRVRLDGTNVVTLDDPRLFDNPIIYVSEPGFWAIRDSEAVNLRHYLLKGGFVIFDDFEGPDHWNNMVAQMRQALPEHQFIQIDARHPIFHSFFDINQIDVPHPSVRVTPGYWALFEDNDPTKRMIALANHNNDIAEYWEWSAEGLYAEDHTGSAYRLGINYFVYAMTH